MSGRSPYGRRTIITLVIAGDQLPAASRNLLQLLGLEVEGTPVCVYLPAGTSSFGLLANGRAFAELDTSAVKSIDRGEAGKFWAVGQSVLGRYFGWTARGARVEFVRHDD